MYPSPITLEQLNRNHEAFLLQTRQNTLNFWYGPDGTKLKAGLYGAGLMSILFIGGPFLAAAGLAGAIYNEHRGAKELARVKERLKLLPQ